MISRATVAVVVEGSAFVRLCKEGVLPRMRILVKVAAIAVIGGKATRRHPAAKPLRLYPRCTETVPVAVDKEWVASPAGALLGTGTELAIRQ